jgi:hypothetical protein
MFAILLIAPLLLFYIVNVCLVAADKYIVPAFCKGCNDMT